MKRAIGGCKVLLREIIDRFGDPLKSLSQYPTLSYYSRQARRKTKESLGFHTIFKRLWQRKLNRLNPLSSVPFAKLSYLVCSPVRFWRMTTISSWRKNQLEYKLVVQVITFLKQVMNALVSVSSLYFGLSFLRQRLIAVPAS